MGVECVTMLHERKGEEFNDKVIRKIFELVKSQVDFQWTWFACMSLDFNLFVCFISRNKESVPVVYCVKERLDWNNQVIKLDKKVFRQERGWDYTD